MNALVNSAWVTDWPGQYVGRNAVRIFGILSPNDGGVWSETIFAGWIENHIKVNRSTFNHALNHPAPVHGLGWLWMRKKVRHVIESHMEYQSWIGWMTSYMATSMAEGYGVDLMTGIYIHGMNALLSSSGCDSVCGSSNNNGRGGRWSASNISDWDRELILFNMPAVNSIDGVIEIWRVEDGDNREEDEDEDEEAESTRRLLGVFKPRRVRVDELEELLPPTIVFALFPRFGVEIPLRILDFGLFGVVGRLFAAFISSSRSCSSRCCSSNSRRASSRNMWTLRWQRWLVSFREDNTGPLSVWIIWSVSETSKIPRWAKRADSRVEFCWDKIDGTNLRQCCCKR